MTRVQRVLVASAMLAATLLAADRQAVGQAGELAVTLRVLDDVTGVVAARITIPPEPARTEVQERPAPQRTPAEAQAPPAKSGDPPPRANVSQ